MRLLPLLGLGLLLSAPLRAAPFDAPYQRQGLQLYSRLIAFKTEVGEGQVPVNKLQRKISTLPRALKPPAVSDLNYRLRALQPTMQMPKGPLPKGARQPRMPKPR